MRWPVNIENVRSFFTRWYTKLLLICLGLFCVLVTIFYPGYLSPDSLDQAQQALRITPLADWHPVSMTLLWRLFIDITGTIGSFIVVQLLILCAALYGLAVFVYKTTRTFKWAASVFLLALLPCVLGIAGVVWKDVLMAFLLLLASVLFLIAGTLKGGSGKAKVLVIAGLLASVYAGMLRYNAIIAIIPLLFLAPKLLGLRASAAQKITSVIIGVCTVVLLSFVLNTQSKSTYPATAIMLDDIVHIAPRVGDERSAKVYQKIETTCNTSTSEIMNSYILCTDEGDRTFIRENHSHIEKDWVSALLQNPVGYIQYRVSIFAIFLFPEEGRMYIYQNGSVDNGLGVTSSRYVTQGLGAYVNGFGKTNFTFMFQPWFWFVVLLGVVYYARRKVKDAAIRAIVLAVAFSGLLYGALYIVAAVATDYRYSYWMVLASLFCVVVLTATQLRFGAKRKSIKHR